MKKLYQVSNSTFILFLIATILLPTQFVVSGISLAISDFVLVFLLISILFINRNNTIFIKKNWLFWVSIFLLTILLSFFTSFRFDFGIESVNSSIVSLIKIIVCIIYFSAFSIFYSLINKEQYIKYLKVLFIVGIIVSTTCILGVLLSKMGIDNPFTKYGNRGSGTFDDPNLAAVYLLLSIGYSALNLPFVKNQRIIYLGIAYMIFGLFATVSKGAFISFLASLFFVFILTIILNLKKHRNKMILCILFGFIAFMFLANFTTILDPILSRFANINDLNELTTGRIDLWIQGLKITQYDFNLFFGVGIGQFENALSHYGYTIINRAHNTYLSFLTECGVFPLILLISFLVYLLNKTIRLMAKNRNTTVIFLTFALVCVLIELFSLNLQNSRTTYVFLSFIYFYIVKFNLFEVKNYE